MDEIEKLNEKINKQQEIIIEIYEALKKSAGVFESIKKQIDNLITTLSALIITVTCLVNDNLKDKIK